METIGTIPGSEDIVIARVRLVPQNTAGSTDLELISCLAHTQSMFQPPRRSAKIEQFESGYMVLLLKAYSPLHLNPKPYNSKLSLLLHRDAAKWRTSCLG